MDLKLIVLGAILLIVLYILFQVFTKKRVSLGKAEKLSKDPVTYSYNTMSIPGSANYYILLWLYVDSLGNTDTVLYTLDGGNLLKVFLTNKGELKYSVNIETKIVVDSFPIQTWSCLILSIEGNSVIDTYLNGKLVKSHKLGTTLTSTDTSSVLSLGSADNTDDTDIKVTKFERKAITMDPATAYELYNSDKPNNSMGSMFSDYGISLRLTKNSSSYSSITFPGGVEFNDGDTMEPTTA